MYLAAASRKLVKSLPEHKCNLSFGKAVILASASERKKREVLESLLNGFR